MAVIVSIVKTVAVLLHNIFQPVKEIWKLDNTTVTEMFFKEARAC